MQLQTNWNQSNVGKRTRLRTTIINHILDRELRSQNHFPEKGQQRFEKAREKEQFIIRNNNVLAKAQKGEKAIVGTHK